jgi:hypothetical protein
MIDFSFIKDYKKRQRERKIETIYCGNLRELTKPKQIKY